MRDAENRLMFCGYDPRGFELLVWTLSAVICGLAGALYIPQVGIINPSEMSPTNSIEAAIWVALGGRGTLIGPVLWRRIDQRCEKHFHRSDARVLAAVSRPHLHHCDPVLPAGDGPAASRRPLMQPDEGLFTRQLPGDRFREQTDPVLQLENINVSFDGFGR